MISIEQLTRSDLEELFAAAYRHRSALESGEPCSMSSEAIVATLFMQPSTRTRLSFEAAALRLGGKILSMSDPAASRAGSEWKESLADTARVLNGYADVVVLRHPVVGSAAHYATMSTVPVVNGGDGAGPGSEHPTQTILDLFTIDDLCGSVDGATVCVLGDLSQRCVHSLLAGLSLFSDVTVLAKTEETTRLTERELQRHARHGLKVEYVDDLAEALRRSDIVYACGHEDPTHEIPLDMRLDPRTLRGARPDLRILHPLPRGVELPTSLDGTAHAAYFEQAANGVPVRMAVLERILSSCGSAVA
ncbi:aspartate/ornithine carbamoyltransferase family protein [Salinarimonas ramus]|uniref:aspartate/ornithine carbamoyltransferase family protein n=1 Tax=Salinarimonas ramus TaxID=690164 RepID=UPI001663C532|nr:aspartate carbamoyltransferase [Salinarimonas ramus]